MSLKQLPDLSPSRVNKLRILLVLPQQGKTNKTIFLALQSQLHQLATGCALCSRSPSLRKLQGNFYQSKCFLTQSCSIS